MCNGDSAWNSCMRLLHTIVPNPHLDSRFRLVVVAIAVTAITVVVIVDRYYFIDFPTSAKRTFEVASRLCRPSNQSTPTACSMG